MLTHCKEPNVRQRAYRLCPDIYRLKRGFPEEEKCNLASRMRRSAVSIPSDVAEGCGRKTTPGYARQLYIACGSTGGLETQVLISRDLGDAREEGLAPLQEAMREVERMLKALIKSLEGKHSNP